MADEQTEDPFDIRTDLEAAYSNEEGSEEVGGSEEDTEEPVGVAEEGEAEAEPLAAEGEPDTDGDTGGAGEEGVAASEEAVEVGAAPASWKPDTREHWAKLPPDVRDEVTRRERETNVAIQRYAEEGRFGAAMEKALAPYQSVIAMEGADSISAMRSLAHTAGTLRMGTPQQKAETVAHIIKSYAVDITTLDNILVGEPAASPEATQMQNMIQQELGPIRNFMTEVQSGRQQHEQTRANSHTAEIDTFEKGAEFFEDVREDMADLIEMAHNRGRTMTLQQAYDRSVASHPDIAPIAAKRSEAATLVAGKTKLAAKRAAADSSMPGGRPAQGNGAAEPGTLRGALEAAVDAAEG